jgi:hypothetical protein
MRATWTWKSLVYLVLGFITYVTTDIQGSVLQSCVHNVRKLSHPDSSETNSRLFPEGEALPETIFRVIGLQYRPHSAVKHTSLPP